MNVEKTFRPKAGHENAEVTFPNSLTGETIEIKSWPYTTSSSVEMAFLSDHAWLTDAPERKASTKSTDTKGSE